MTPSPPRALIQGHHCAVSLPRDRGGGSFPIGAGYLSRSGARRRWRRVLRQPLDLRRVEFEQSRRPLDADLFLEQACATPGPARRSLTAVLAPPRCGLRVPAARRRWSARRVGRGRPGSCPARGDVAWLSPARSSVWWRSYSTSGDLPRDPFVSTTAIVTRPSATPAQPPSTFASHGSSSTTRLRHPTRPTDVTPRPRLDTPHASRPFQPPIAPELAEPLPILQV
jgi:hypothetical protein